MQKIAFGIARLESTPPGAAFLRAHVATDDHVRDRVCASRRIFYRGNLRLAKKVEDLPQDGAG